MGLRAKEGFSFIFCHFFSGNNLSIFKGTGSERKVETTKEAENNWWSKVTGEAVGEKIQNKDERLSTKQKVEWDGGEGSEVQEQSGKSDKVTVKIHWETIEMKHWRNTGHT